MKPLQLIANSLFFLECIKLMRDGINIIISNGKSGKFSYALYFPEDILYLA